MDEGLCAFLPSLYIRTCTVAGPEQLLVLNWRERKNALRKKNSLLPLLLKSARAETIKKYRPRQKIELSGSSDYECVPIFTLGKL